jgi:hypothetical protein
LLSVPTSTSTGVKRLRTGTDLTLQALLPSANNAALPSSLSAVLTWNGTAGATQTYSTTGRSLADHPCPGPQHRHHHYPVSRLLRQINFKARSGVLWPSSTTLRNLAVETFDSLNRTSGL